MFKCVLSWEKRSSVDEAQSKVLVDFHQRENPIKAVLDILNVLAVDQPFVVVTKLINSLKRSLRFDERKTKIYLHLRLAVLEPATDHLQHISATPSSQVGQFLVITLLDKPNLIGNVLTNAKVQLISLAQQREAEEKNVNGKQVNNFLFKSAENILEGLLHIWKAHSTKSGSRISKILLELISGFENISHNIQEIILQVHNTSRWCCYSLPRHQSVRSKAE